MSARESLRKLLLEQAADRSAVGAVVLASGIYLAIGIVAYSFVAITWDRAPGPLAFVVMFDLLFALLAIGGLTFRADEAPGVGTLSGLRTVLIASGGAWQIIKSLAKGLLFVLPFSAFEAVKSAIPPLGAADDHESLKVLRRLAVLKGGVPLQLFRYLCGNPSSSSFNRAIGAAEYLDAAQIRGRGADMKVVPGLQLPKLAAAIAAGRTRAPGATQPGSSPTRVETERTQQPPR